ncbi:MAG: lipoate--protein ligase family protein [Isosphaeraceae bacterium]
MPESLPPIAHLDRTLPTVEANLALDEALLIESEANGGAVLRTWELPHLAVVMGATCRFRDEVNVERCRLDGVPIARRTSGGGTVLIGPGALNFAVILPRGASKELESVEGAQRFVMERTARAIRGRGIAVELAGSGDWVVGDRKVSGSAQRRLKSHLMVHATILDAFPLGLIGQYLGTPRRQPAYRAGRPHGDFVANLGMGRSALRQAIRSAWPGPDRPVEVPEGTIRALIDERLGNQAWIERF